MSGDFSRLVGPRYYRNSENTGKYFLRFCHGLAVLAISMLVLNTGSIESTALAKSKYFSGKSKVSRSHHASRRHKSRNHYNSGYTSSKKSAQHRRYTKRHGIHNRYAKVGRSNNYGYRTVRYRGPSVINVGKALLNKRAGNTRLSYNHRGYRKHTRNRHRTIKRVIISGSVATLKNGITRHVLEEDPRGNTAIYYDTELCKQDYDCVMRTGTKRSSAKIIVVGSKRDESNHIDSNGVKIIHPPL